MFINGMVSQVRFYDWRAQLYKLKPELEPLEQKSKQTSWRKGVCQMKLKM